MKKEYHSDTDSNWAIFEAGHAFDSLGAPAPYWGCTVVYTWSHRLQVYWVYSIQRVCFGDAGDRVTQESEMATLREVNHYLTHLKDMEECFRRVFE